MNNMFKKNKEGNDYSKMIVTFEMPITPAFKQLVKEFKDKAQIDEKNKTILIGHKYVGLVHVEKSGYLGDWIARGEGNLSYERAFGARKKIGVVIDELSKELAYMKLTVDEVKRYITDYDIKGSDLRVVKFGSSGEEMRFNEPD